MPILENSKLLIEMGCATVLQIQVYPQENDPTFIEKLSSREKSSVVCNVFVIQKQSVYLKHFFQNMVLTILYVRLCSTYPALVRLL